MNLRTTNIYDVANRRNWTKVCTKIRSILYPDLIFYSLHVVVYFVFTGQVEEFLTAPKRAYDEYLYRDEPGKILFNIFLLFL